MNAKNFLPLQYISMIKKHSLLVAGVAGMLFGLPYLNGRAEGTTHISEEKSHYFAMDEQTSFIFLPDYGFSVSVTSPHDIIFSENLYFLFRDGVWYRSAFCRGPWDIVQKEGVPYNIRSLRWDDIKQLRDNEYRRRRNIMYWEDSDQHQHQHRHKNRNQINQKEIQDRRITRSPLNQIDQEGKFRIENNSYKK